MRHLLNRFCTKPIVTACAFLFCFAGSAAESPRERLLMDFNWRFQLGDAPDAGTLFDYPEVNDLAQTRLNEIGQGAILIEKLSDPTESNLGVNVSFVKASFDDI